MKILDPGHDYLVDVYSPHGTETNFEFGIGFVKKIGENFPGNEGAPKFGTNCQELLRVIIDRVKYLNKQKPSAHNRNIYQHLIAALAEFEIRAAHLKGQSFVPHEDIEDMKPCKICGHIFDHTHE